MSDFARRDITRITDDPQAIDAVAYLKSKGCTLADFQFLLGYLELSENQADQVAAVAALSNLKILLQARTHAGLQ